MTTVYERTLAAQEKTVVNRGGARSSKSYSIAQLLIEKATNTPRAILVTRKTMPSLKMTAYKLIIDLLKDYGYYKEERDWQTAPLHYCLGPSTFWFCSLDELTKIKSTEFTDIWMEEANEFTWQDYLTLKLRLSGKVPEGDRARIYLSFNPMDAAHWIPTKLCRQPDVLEIVSTYLDNPFLTQDYIDTLLALKEEDPNYYKIYALGEYGSVEGLIYQNFNFQELPGDPDYVCYGLDFGWNNPTVLIEIAIRDQELYLRELIYQSHLLTSSPDPEQETLLTKMADLEIDSNAVITADSEDPKTIEEIYTAGYNIQPVSKERGSVRRGIDLVKRRKKHIHPASVNLAKEFQAYRWKVDKNGNVLDEPVKFLDHGMDAVRYGVQGVEDMIEEEEISETVVIDLHEQISEV